MPPHSPLFPLCLRPRRPPLPPPYPPLERFAGDNGEGEDGGSRAREEGDSDGASKGETVQSGRIFVEVPPAEGLGPRGLDPLDHH